MIYLDYNSTTPLLNEAKEAMISAFELIGNPSSVHSYGRKARKELENARDMVSEYLDILARNITFTSGATESNNLIINGFKDKVIIESTAHDSLLKAKENFDSIKVNEEGLIDLNHLEELIKQSDKKVLVAVTLVNNETGVIQPISQIQEICSKNNVHLHVDAAQAISKIKLDYKKIDSFSLSAHKFGGPKGIGALIINTPLELTPQIKGGGQEKGMRSGTENVIGAIGMGAALKAFNFDWEKLQELRDYLEKSLLEISRDLVIFCKNAKRISNTSAFSLKGIKSEIQMMRFDENNIAISSGSACSSGKVKTSHVLKAMGIDDNIAKCAIRLSMGWHTTKKDIDAFLNVWSKFYSTEIR